MLKRTLLVVALAAIPGAAEARDVVQPSAVSRSATVAGGATRTLELSCPTPAVALNATATGLPAGADSAPLAPGDRRARLEPRARGRRERGPPAARRIGSLPEAGAACRGQGVRLAASTSVRAGPRRPGRQHAAGGAALRRRLHPHRLRPRHARGRVGTAAASSRPRGAGASGSRTAPAPRRG